MAGKRAKAATPPTTETTEQTKSTEADEAKTAEAPKTESVDLSEGQKLLDAMKAENEKQEKLLELQKAENDRREKILQDEKDFAAEMVAGEQGREITELIQPDNRPPKFPEDAETIEVYSPLKQRPDDGQETVCVGEGYDADGFPTRVPIYSTDKDQPHKVLDTAEIQEMLKRERLVKA